MKKILLVMMSLALVNVVDAKTKKLDRKPASAGQYQREVAKLLTQQQGLKIQATLIGNICGDESPSHIIFSSLKNQSLLLAFPLNGTPSYEGPQEAELFNLSDCSKVKFTIEQCLGNCKAG